jgi:hypothetical protein
MDDGNLQVKGAGDDGIGLMDRAQLAQLLQQAEDRVRQGEEHIRHQQRIIAELERDAHDSAMARQLLATFEDIQALHVAGRDRLIRALAEYDRRTSVETKNKTET